MISHDIQTFIPSTLLLFGPIILNGVQWYILTHFEYEFSYSVHLRGRDP